MQTGTPVLREQDRISLNGSLYGAVAEGDSAQLLRQVLWAIG
jgi:hypothetical protein